MIYQFLNKGRMKNIELPSKVVVGEGAIYKVKEIAEDLDLGRLKSLVIADKTTQGIAGDTVVNELDAEIFILKQNSPEETNEIVAKIRNDNI